MLVTRSLRATASRITTLCRRNYSEITQNPTRLVQIMVPKAGRRLGLVSYKQDFVVDLTSIDPKITSVHSMFSLGYGTGLTLHGLLAKWKQDNKIESARTFSYKELIQAPVGSKHGWLMAPIDHPEDEAHCLISGTGLTHLGSSAARDQMHRTADNAKTDSQKMFEMGLKGGKPNPGIRGIPPEWFYKGNGYNLVGHNDFLEIPDFTEDGGEEPEIIGCYIIGKDKVPYRIGFAVGNDWSDHPMEKINYLWLPPSKLRQCAMGPELVLLPSFKALEGECRIIRGDQEIYNSGKLLTGEEHMTHSLANIEDHQFKYPQFRLPGDVHLHFFGTSKLSYPNRPPFQTGDKIEISFSGMGPKLVNYVKKLPSSSAPVVVKDQLPLKYS